LLEIQLLEPARIELDEAFSHYENQLEGLGVRFLDEVLQVFHNIKSDPKAWPVFSERTRRCLLSKFPYSVIYQIREDIILVVAVAHLHRKPDYWQNRLE